MAQCWLEKSGEPDACTQVVPHALPAQLAAALLLELLQDSTTYKRGKWRIFQQLKDMPRTNCHYVLDAQVCTTRRADFAIIVPPTGLATPKGPAQSHSQLLWGLSRRLKQLGRAQRTCTARAPRRRPSAKLQTS